MHTIIETKTHSLMSSGATLLLGLLLVFGLTAALPVGAIEIEGTGGVEPAPAGTVTGCTGEEGEFCNSYETYSDDQNPIYVRLNQIISFLSVGIGVAITISVIVAGFQWTTSRGDPQQYNKAVNRLVNTGIALLLFVFGWALLNWLIPGGSF